MFHNLLLFILISESGIGHFFKLRNIQEVFKNIPLPEDVMLKGLPVLRNVHEPIDWEYLRQHSLHTKEEVIVFVFLRF